MSEEQVIESSEQVTENGDGAGKQPGPVPYERCAEVNRRAKELAAQVEAIQRKQAEAEQAALAEQGKWKELYEKREAELTSERLERARLNVALKTGLPPEFAGRLMGQTEEELLADAQSLLPLVRPSSPGAARAPARTQPASFTSD